MASSYEEFLYIERAKNELDLAETIYKISNERDLKARFDLKPDSTFYSNVIGISYFCIFYAAKAFLELNGVETKPPEEHRKTLEEFERLASSGEIDVSLLKIYKSMIIKADELLEIFKIERAKRGRFTYKKLPQANRQPAEESLKNAKKFFWNINVIIRNKSSQSQT